MLAAIIKKMRLFIILFTILVYNSTFAQRTDELAAVDSIIQPFNKPDAPGLSIGIVENGKMIYFKGVGFANIETNTKNSSNSIFGIASIAKQFTAACIWNLINEKKISLDDDIRKYIPEFPSYGNKILVRHMLNHTSGIRNYHAIMELAGFDYDKQFHDNQTILELACKQKGLNNAPGEKVIYGNTGYTLLAIIIERITGQNLNEYAKKNIFLPLGMNNTFYRTDSASIIPNRALGYVLNDMGKYEPQSSNQITYGAGSVSSSVEDLAIWSTILNGKNAKYIDLTNFLTTVEKLPSGETAKYARGVMVDDYKKKKTVHHSGYGLGGQSQIISMPELNISVIILTNLESIDPTPISYKILDLFLPPQNNDLPIAAKRFEPKRNNFKKFVGQYKEQSSDMKMEITLENDTLKALGGQGEKPIPLTSIEKRKFVRLNNSNVLYDFSPNKTANSDLIVYFGGTPFYFSKAKFLYNNNLDLTQYTGYYYSEELSVEYEVYVANNNLYVSYPNHPNMKLMAGQVDEFGNGQRVLYRFERSKENEVIRLFLSAEGTVKNIKFVKK